MQPDSNTDIYAVFPCAGRGLYHRRRYPKRIRHESIAHRFWSKVNFDGPIPNHDPSLDPCWVWLGAKSWNSYGTFHVPLRHSVGAHRWAYEFCRGAIPDGLTLDHLCLVILCVNPDHLEPVTVSENVRRRWARDGRGDDFCLRGHPYDEANSYRRRGRHPALECRACRRMKQRDWYKAQTASR